MEGRGGCVGSWLPCDLTGSVNFFFKVAQNVQDIPPIFRLLRTLSTQTCLEYSTPFFIQFKKDNVQFKKAEVRIKKDEVRIKKDVTLFKKDNLRFKNPEIQIKKDEVKFKKDKVQFKTKSRHAIYREKKPQYLFIGMYVYKSVWYMSA